MYVTLVTIDFLYYCSGLPQVRPSSMYNFFRDDEREGILVTGLPERSLKLFGMKGGRDFILWSPG